MSDGGSSYALPITSRGTLFQHCNSEQTVHMSILAICASILLGLWAVETVAFFLSYWQSAKGSATETIETHL